MQNDQYAVVAFTLVHARATAALLVAVVPILVRHMLLGSRCGTQRALGLRFCCARGASHVAQLLAQSSPRLAPYSRHDGSLWRRAVPRLLLRRRVPGPVSAGDVCVGGGQLWLLLHAGAQGAQPERVVCLALRPALTGQCRQRAAIPRDLVERKEERVKYIRQKSRSWHLKSEYLMVSML